MLVAYARHAINFYRKLYYIALKMIFNRIFLTRTDALSSCSKTVIIFFLPSISGVIYNISFAWGRHSLGK